MKAQAKKKAYMKVDAAIHRALKIASIQAEKSLEELSDEVIREGLKVKGIPLVEGKASRVHGTHRTAHVQA